jgi:hypothetical protein
MYKTSRNSFITRKLLSLDVAVNPELAQDRPQSRIVTSTIPIPS